MKGETQKKPVKLSVIVCTYNRAHAIIPCLDSIAASLAHDAPVDAEIVVVDNASTDNTSAILREWAKTCAFTVNLQLETKKGLAAARNCGIRAARGELLAWTDDDCRLSKNYVADLLRHDAEDGDKLVFRGGRVELGDPADLPLTIKMDMTPQHWRKERRWQKCVGLGGAFMGANMTMRRALVDKIGLFDERFGSGAAIPGGDEVDYIFRAYLANILIEYVPDMVVYHYHGRKQISEGFKLYRGYMIGRGALYAKHFASDPNLCRSGYWDFKLAIREIIFGKSLYRPEIGFSYKRMMVFMAQGVFLFLSTAIKKRA